MNKLKTLTEKLREEVEALKKRVAELEAQTRPTTFTVAAPKVSDDIADNLLNTLKHFNLEVPNGELTLNQARIALGKEPIPGGDDQWVSSIHRYDTK